VNAPTPSPATTVMLPVASLRPNPWNRKKYDEAKFKDLVASVRNIGLLQAIVARPIEGAGAGQPTHEIVAGERRWRACTEAGFAEIPATVRKLTDLELIEALLVENTEREEMNALDEATCLQALVRKPGQLQGYESVDDMAMHIGRSRAYCYQRIKLLTLCPEVQAALREGQISANHALRMARLASADDQAAALKACMEGWGGNPMSVRDLDAYIHRTFMLDLARATFNIKSETLLPTAGSCTSCPKRSGNTPELFDDVKKGDTCTDGACYAAKQEAHRIALIAKAEAEGKKVISGAAAKKAMPQQYSRDIKGLLKLDAIHYELDGSKPLRKLLGKHPLEVLVFEDPHTKDLHDVVREDDAVALLKERGVLKQGRMPTTSASQRQADAKLKAEKAWRTAAAEAVVAAAGGEMKADLRGRMVWFIAMLVWRELAHDTKERVTKLLGWPPLPSNWESGTGKTANDHFEALTAGQLQQFFVACMVSADLAINSYTPAGKPNRINTWARELGVDLEAIKDQLRAATAKRVESPANAAKKAKAKGQPEQTPVTALAAAVDKAKTKRTELERTVKYRDAATGSTWSGRGLQPRWLKVALEGGKTLADFAVAAKAAPKAHISAAAADVMSQAAA
jgi:ParB/RepB/Spo0J family partition protein